MIAVHMYDWYIHIVPIRNCVEVKRETTHIQRTDNLSIEELAVQSQHSKEQEERDPHEYQWCY